MMKKTCLFIILAVLFPGLLMAEVTAGNIVALRGKTEIQRGAQTREAKLKDGIELRDTVETKQASRTKILFVDDSLLTLGENSRLVVKEYVAASGGKRGRSVFNLIDGKLRSLVGSGELEIHTATMAIASRGTYFIAWVGLEEGVPVSGVIVLEGVVEVYNINPAIKGVVRLEPGTMTKVFENKPPVPTMPTPPSLQQELINATELQEVPEVMKTPIPVESSSPVIQQLPPPTVTETLPVTPPIENQTPSSTTPVKIRIPIPEGI